MRFAVLCSLAVFASGLAICAEGPTFEVDKTGLTGKHT